MPKTPPKKPPIGMPVPRTNPPATNPLPKNAPATNALGSTSTAAMKPIVAQSGAATIKIHDIPASVASPLANPKNSLPNTPETDRQISPVAVAKPAASRDAPVPAQVVPAPVKVDVVAKTMAAQIAEPAPTIAPKAPPRASIAPTTTLPAKSGATGTVAKPDASQPAASFLASTRAVTTKSVAAKRVVAKPVGLKPVAAKPVVAKPAASKQDAVKTTVVKPVVSKPVASEVAAEMTKRVETAPVPTVAVTASVKPSVKHNAQVATPAPPPTLAAGLSTPILATPFDGLVAFQRASGGALPENAFANPLATAAAAHWLGYARALADIQAVMLDQGCMILNRNLSALERSANASSPSEWFAVQGEELRRSSETMVDAVKVVATTAMSVSKTR